MQQSLFLRSLSLHNSKLSIRPLINLSIFRCSFFAAVLERFLICRVQYGTRCGDYLLPFLAVYKKLVLAEMVFIYQQARVKDIDRLVIDSRFYWYNDQAYLFCIF